MDLEKLVAIQNEGRSLSPVGCKATSKSSRWNKDNDDDASTTRYAVCAQHRATSSQEFSYSPHGVLDVPWPQFQMESGREVTRPAQTWQP